MVSVHSAATATRDGTTDPGAPPAASGRRMTRRRFEGCPAPNVPPRGGSASAAGDERDDDVGGVAVEVLTAPVVDGRGAGVGVTSGRDAGSVGSKLPWSQGVIATPALIGSGPIGRVL